MQLPDEVSVGGEEECIEDKINKHVSSVIEQIEGLSFRYELGNLNGRQSSLAFPTLEGCIDEKKKQQRRQFLGPMTFSVHANARMSLP